MRLSITAPRQATDDHCATPCGIIAQLVGSGCSLRVGLACPHDAQRARRLQQLAIAPTIEDKWAPCAEASQTLGIARGKDRMEANPELVAALEERAGSRAAAP